MGNIPGYIKNRKRGKDNEKDSVDELFRSLSALELNVVRRLYHQDALKKAADWQVYDKSLKQRLSEFVRRCGFGDCIRNAIPARKWVPQYRVNEYLFHDVVAGFTNAIVQITQGMGTAILSHLHPIVGLYMAFFPVLMYVLLGNSPHISLGTFGVACLMAGNVVLEHATVEEQETIGKYTPSEVVSALSFVVGLVMLLMWCLRLGALSSLLSEPLVSGLTTGAAFHICASQFKDIIGVKICKTPANYKVIYNVMETIEHFPETNMVCVIISFITCAMLAINNILLKPWMSKKSRIPLPAEFIAVVVGTLVSRYMALMETYHVNIVGMIPTGLPLPVLPPFELFNEIIVDSITITMVTYTIAMSMGLTFAYKDKYEIDANQELLALGASNIFGSFFMCGPICAGLSRSYLLYAAGGRTLMASLVSALIIMVVLLWFGPLFEPLPRCVLASIVLMSLKGLFVQLGDLKRFWQLSMLDAIVWLVTFLVTVIISVEIGLAASLLASVGQLFFRAQSPYTCLLGRVMDTDLYMDIKRYRAAKEIRGLKIFHYCGSLNFATKNLFRSRLLQKIGYMRATEQMEDAEDDTGTIPGAQYEWDPYLNQKVQCVIIDASALSNVDASGVKVLISVEKDLSASKIITYFTGPNAPVLEMIARFNSLEKEPLALLTFPSIHDAVIYFLISKKKRKRALLKIAKENREQRAENREQRSENREQRSVNREQRADNREQRTESKEQRTETKKQASGNRQHVHKVEKSK